MNVKCGLPSEDVYTKLKEDILAGNYMPGVHLVEANLMKTYSVSRGTIREVLRRLESDSIVEAIPNHGVRVRKLTLQQIKDYYIVLQSLEGLAARLLACDLNYSMEKLDQYMLGLEVTVNENDFDEYLVLIHKIHDWLVVGTNNEALIEPVKRIHTLINMQFILRPLKPRMQESLQNHKNLFDAIRNHAPEQAEHIMRNHIEGTIKIITNDLMNKG